MNSIIKITIFLFTTIHLYACNSTSSQEYIFIGDGKTLNTESIQKAINECSQNGGGIVTIPKGEYLTGTIVLKRGVILHLEKGAILSGSRNESDYPDVGRRKALIFAERANNIAITGDGEINGNGNAFFKDNNTPNRPTLVLFMDCKNVNVEGIKMSNSGFWTFRFVRCDGVDINNVYVEGHANWNNDGFDIESRNVTISNCILDTDDDAICFKNEDPDYIVENVTITNCQVSSNCNFIKFGTASNGGYRNIKISDCTLSKCSKSFIWKWYETIPGVTENITGIAGIALEVVDGGFMENVTISNITMEDVQTPIFIRLGRRQVSGNSYLKDILLENIKAKSTSYIASSITGVPGLRVDNVEIRNIDFELKAGGKASDTEVEVPEVEEDYPENRMFGVILPAYGFYIRHADNIKFSNINLAAVGGREERHAIFIDDATNIIFENATIQVPDGNKSLFCLKSSENIYLNGEKIQ